MAYYFIVTVYYEPGKEAEAASLYQAYIRDVRPIVEQFGGRYLVRTEDITCLSREWNPDRVIVIAFPNKEQLEACFASEAYRKIKSRREDSVRSMAVIVPGTGAPEQGEETHP